MEIPTSGIHTVRNSLDSSNTSFINQQHMGHHNVQTKQKEQKQDQQMKQAFINAQIDELQKQILFYQQKTTDLQHELDVYKLKALNIQTEFATYKSQTGGGLQFQIERLYKRINQSDKFNQQNIRILENRVNELQIRLTDRQNQILVLNHRNDQKDIIINELQNLNRVNQENNNERRQNELNRLRTLINQQIDLILNEEQNLLDGFENQVQN